MTTKIKRSQKNLTVMFTDISGFTKHTETISRDELMSRLETHNTLLMPIIAHFEGKIVKSIGDSFLITFESPTNAVQCGLFMQHTLAKHNVDKAESQQIHIKVSINSGEVTVTENDVFGDPVNVAAKIEKATNPDEIYFTESVFLAMNKSEVPTSFVKTFRPKGAESQEIKLYRVAMDEGDQRYQKIISGTTIDPEKMKTRVIELSNVAEKEFIRYQDTLDALVETHKGSSRSTVLAIIGASVILAIAIIIGFAVFGGENEEKKVIEMARTYLASDKPEDARLLLGNFIDSNGDSTALKQAMAEVNAYELNLATRRAEEFLASGQAERAMQTLRAALRGDSPGARQSELLQRAEATVQARTALLAGDTVTAHKKIEEATGSEGPTSELTTLRERTKALESARAILGDDVSRRTLAMQAVNNLEIAFDNNFRSEVAANLLIEALSAHSFWYARNEGLESAREDLVKLRSRFTTLNRGWPEVEWHSYRGALYHLPEHAAQARRAWWNFYDREFTTVYNYLGEAAKGNAAREYELGLDIYTINRRLHLIRIGEQIHLRNALEIDPSLLDTHRDKWLEMVRIWLHYEDHDAGLGRELARTRFYDAVRPDLIEGLAAARGDRPDLTRRANSVALLADRRDLDAFEDPFAFFRDCFDIFMLNDWDRTYGDGRPAPQTLTRDQVRAFFSVEMDLRTYREFLELLQRTAQDIANREGRYGSYNYGSITIQRLIDDLRQAQPMHAAAD